MSSYSFSSASFGNWVALQTALQSDLAGAYSTATDGTTRSTSSGSFSSLHNTTISIAADELLFVIASIQTSNGTNNATSNFRLSIDGTAVQDRTITEMTGQTNTNSATTVLFGFAENKSGTINVTLYFSAGSGTNYVSATNIGMLKTKKR